MRKGMSPGETIVEFGLNAYSKTEVTILKGTAEVNFPPRLPRKSS
jgi:hypothetical protein